MKRREIPILLAIFLDLVGFGMAFPDLSIRLREFGLPQVIVGAILAALFLTQFFASPRWGALSDRIGRKPVIIACTLLSALSMLVYALATDAWGVLLSRILAGLAAANVVVSQAYLADATTEDERAGAMGRIGAAISCGLISGPTLGGWLAEQGGSRLLGFVAASASLAGALALLLFLKNEPPKEARAPGKQPIIDFRLIREFPHIRSLFVLAVVSWFALACLEGTFVPLLKERYHFPQFVFGFPFHSERSAGGTIFGFESLIGVVVQGFLLSWISKRLERRTLLRIGYLLQGLGLILTPFAPFFGILIMFSAIYSIGQGLANPTVNAACSALTPPERQGEVFGLLQGARSLGFFLGPMIGGALFDLHYAAPYLLAGITGVAAFLLVPPTVNAKSPAALPSQPA